MRSNIPRLTPVSWSRFIQRLRELGFDGPYAGGRHPYMQRGDITLIIPNPHQGDIGVGLLRRLLQQAEEYEIKPGFSTQATLAQRVARHCQ